MHRKNICKMKTLLTEKEHLKKQIDLIDDEEFINAVKQLFSYYIHKNESSFDNILEKINSEEKFQNIENKKKSNFFDICGIWENREFNRKESWRTKP